MCGYLSEFPVVVECPQCVQLFQGQYKCLCWRGIHEVKVNQIVDTQTLKQQYNIPQVRALNLK